MDIYQRIKFLRTDILPNKLNKKISQTEFGRLLGLGRDVICNLEYNRVEVKEHMVNLICKTFNVNEDWLRNGNEPIFNDTEEDKVILKLKEKYNLDDAFASVLKTFSNLDEFSKNNILNFMIKSIEDYYLNNPDKLCELNAKMESLKKFNPAIKKQQEPPQEMVKITARYGGIKYISKEEMDEIERTARVLTDEELDDFI